MTQIINSIKTLDSQEKISGVATLLIAVGAAGHSSAFGQMVLVAGAGCLLAFLKRAIEG